MRAKLATLEASNNNDPSTTAAATTNGFNGNSASSSQDNAQEVDDLEVDGGQCHKVMVKVSAPRTVVQWQFSSQPRGIAMGLNYQESENGDVKSVRVLHVQQNLSLHTNRESKICGIFFALSSILEQSLL